MEKELVNIIMDKKFIELSSSEKEELKEWCTTEEEFDQLNQVFIGIEQLKAEQIITPKAETKQSLDSLFAQKHIKAASPIWYNSLLVLVYPKDKPFIRRPIVQFAALALIFLMVFPFISTETIIESKQQHAKVEKEFEAKIQDPQEKLIEEKTAEEAASPILMQDKESLLESSINQQEVQDEMPIAQSAIVSGKTMAFASTMSKNDSKTFDHPDGIFTGGSSVTYSQAASSQPAIFDLLTTAF